MSEVCVIGAGLAGSEAAWQLAKRGVMVQLYDMKPHKRSPAHHTDAFAELVCSNSFRAARIENAVGLLKEELRRMGSLIMACADETSVEAGGALAVDRNQFSQMVTERILAHPNITVHHEEVCEIPTEGRVIVATGPLTSDALSDSIRRFFGGAEYLNFFDAAAPLVSFDSVDMDVAWMASRYDKGTADYINCPMTREEYIAFWERLSDAKEAPVHGFEDSGVFEGCMPIEVMARRGEDTMRYGPMKPVGLRDPRTGREPYAVLQLRKDNAQGSIYNLVGCQTHLTFGEQQAVFSLIPALRDAEYLRYGVMHRNTYIDSPRLLDRHYRAKNDPRVSFAGQLTGVEGYVESTASGLYAALSVEAEISGKDLPELSKDTATGALSLYISDQSVTHFQPMNINFGIITPLGYKVKGKPQKNLKIAERALEEIDSVFGKKPESSSDLCPKGE